MSDSSPQTGRNELRVVISAATFVPGGMGGSETYARALVDELSRRASLDLRLVVPESVDDLAPNVQRRVFSTQPRQDALHRIRNVAALGVTARFRHLFREASVVHYPFTVPVPRPVGTPWVTSLLDVQHLDLPGMFTRPERAYRSVLYDNAARRADAVVTISEHAKGRMVEALGLDPETVHVAYLGVDTDRFVPNSGPRDDFVYYPARGWPHKNHGTLVEAMALVRSEVPLRLVLTGGALDTLGSLPDWVDVRGLVSSAEVADLYRRAACLAFPSLYEGFGLPPLEAMAAGCPVAVSDIPVIAEVCGPEAVLFDARDPESIADAILRALETYPRNQASGLNWVSRYTWGRCADVHVGAYLQAADRR